MNTPKKIWAQRYGYTTNIERVYRAAVDRRTIGRRETKNERGMEEELRGVWMRASVAGFPFLVEIDSRISFCRSAEARKWKRTEINRLYLKLMATWRKEVEATKFNAVNFSVLFHPCVSIISFIQIYIYVYIYIYMYVYLYIYVCMYVYSKSAPCRAGACAQRRAGRAV